MLNFKKNIKTTKYILRKVLISIKSKNLIIISLKAYYRNFNFKK